MTIPPIQSVRRHRSARPARPRDAFYRELAESAGHLVAGEADAVANMANLAALLWQALPRLNWAGFYRAIDGELVLGPFIGKPACIRIPLDRGVCGEVQPTCASQTAARPMCRVRPLAVPRAADGLPRIAVIDDARTRTEGVRTRQRQNETCAFFHDISPNAG